MFEYRFKPVGSDSEYRFQVDPRTGILPKGTEAPAPWTALEFKKCSICPLKAEDSPHCPPARALQEVVARFGSSRSMDIVDVEVIAPERTYSRRCDLQTGLQSLMGLVMATSACPVLSKMKGAALFHLPFATLVDTQLRITGFYLVKQYFTQRQGGTPDLALSGLRAIYNDIDSVNRDFYCRVAAASEKDANLNALVNWTCTSSLMATSLEEMLDQLKPMFVKPVAE